MGFSKNTWKVLEEPSEKNLVSFSARVRPKRFSSILTLYVAAPVDEPYKPKPTMKILKGRNKSLLYCVNVFILFSIYKVITKTV